MLVVWLLDDVDCVIVENLSEAEERAFLLADNRLALDSVIDINLVALQLDKMLQLDPETDFSLTVTTRATSTKSALS